MNILQILFEIESRKGANYDSVVVYDDIVDSFDYKNKYAIVEYIRDMSKSNKIFNIVLSHIFDFYRTLASRLGLSRSSVFMAVRDNNGTISLKQGQYKNDLFAYFCHIADKDKIFVSLIPFIRNLMEYIHGDSCAEYITLTSCLHIKNGITNIMNVGDIVKIYHQFSACEGLVNLHASENVKDYILSVAAGVMVEKDIDEVAIENKIVLSIAIRIKAEEYMIREILVSNGGNRVEIDKIKANQTCELYKMYCDAYPKKDDKIELLDEVNIMTPECIHLNSFMYEPLIDMSVYQLKDLFVRCISQLK